MHGIRENGEGETRGKADTAARNAISPGMSGRKQIEWTIKTISIKLASCFARNEESFGMYMRFDCQTVRDCVSLRAISTIGHRNCYIVMLIGQILFNSDRCTHVPAMSIKRFVNALCLTIRIFLYLRIGHVTRTTRAAFLESIKRSHA